MKHEVWFFIGLFVFIFVIWLALGGPTRDSSIVVPSLPAVGLSGTTTVERGYFSLPRAPYAIGDSTSALDSSESIGAPDTDTLPLVLIPGVTLSPASPYRATVSLSTYVSGASSTDARREYVRLSVADTASASVSITGWHLESGATGRYEIIPKGTVVPTTGIVNSESAIVLQPGDSAIIVSGASPVGASFRENECTGYFSSFQTFVPTLPQSCPTAASELATLYNTSYLRDLSCLDYTDSLSTCRVPTRVGSADVTHTCRDFIETYINYNGCVRLHRYDTDFNGTVWRIYLGRDRDEPLWRDRHEVVELLDQNGYTVDAFSY